MDLNLTTPALLFPAISLLLLAYTNRFVTLAGLIRDLHARHKAQPDTIILQQIANLRTRVFLIRDMQGLGIGSLFLCVLCMFLLFVGKTEVAGYVFGISLLLMLGSLALMLREIALSVVALNLHLGDLEHDEHLQR